MTRSPLELFWAAKNIIDDHKDFFSSDRSSIRDDAQDSPQANPTFWDFEHLCPYIYVIIIIGESTGVPSDFFYKHAQRLNLRSTWRPWHCWLSIYLFVLMEMTRGWQEGRRPLGQPLITVCPSNALSLSSPATKVPCFKFMYQQCMSRTNTQTDKQTHTSTPKNTLCHRV